MTAVARSSLTSSNEMLRRKETPPRNAPISEEGNLNLWGARIHFLHVVQH